MGGGKKREEEVLISPVRKTNRCLPAILRRAGKSEGEERYDAIGSRCKRKKEERGPCNAVVFVVKRQKKKRKRKKKE